MKLNKEAILRDSIKILKSNKVPTIKQQRVLGILIVDYKNYIESAGYKIEGNLQLIKKYYISDKEDLIEILETLMWYTK